MTKTLPPPTNLIPESAPFSPEQRAWLNGFFAGYLDLNGVTVTPLSAQESANLMAGVRPAAGGQLGDNDDGEAPWHDPSLEMPERMKLADGRPLRRRMMAAMAQQDCGQCGYSCED
jgi:sulfite reductase (NADPH) flavoprotein alpha-component